jgi:hypothetical protein
MSFKIVRGSGETKYLQTTSFPTSAVTTTTDITLFGWIKAPNNKWNRICSLWSEDGGSPLDTNWLGVENNGVGRAALFPYSQDGSSLATGNGLSSNTWTPLIARSLLGGNGSLKMGAGTEVTDAMGSPWNLNNNTTKFSHFRIGAIYNGTDDDSQTVYFAHLCVWKARLSDGNRDSLLGGAHPLAIDASNILEYWSGASLTGYNGTVLSEQGTGTFTANDADNPTVDDPPSDFPTLTGHQVVIGQGTVKSAVTIQLREMLKRSRRLISLPSGVIVPRLGFIAP